MVPLFCLNLLVFNHSSGHASFNDSLNETASISNPKPFVHLLSNVDSELNEVICNNHLILNFVSPNRQQVIQLLLKKIQLFNDTELLNYQTDPHTHLTIKFKTNLVKISDVLISCNGRTQNLN